MPPNTFCILGIMLDILNNSNSCDLLSILCTSHCAQCVPVCEFPLFTKTRQHPHFTKETEA